MAGLLDGFYTLSDEELYYRKLYESGMTNVEYIRLPSPVESKARLAERIILSSSYYSDSPQSSVMVLKHPVYMPRYMHSHQFVEITSIISGSVEEDIEGNAFRADAGSVVMIMPGYYHSIWTGDENTLAMNLIVERDFFSFICQRFSLSFSTLSYAVFSYPEAAGYVERILAEEAEGDEVSGRMKEAVLSEMLLGLIRSGTEVQKAGTGERREAFRIMSYLEEHSRDATLTSFADEFGITEQYASRLIREKTGMTFSSIIRRLRMEDAARLLSRSNLSAKEISYMVGYTSPEHFSRTFHAWYGMSPDAWRRENS